MVRLRRENASCLGNVGGLLGFRGGEDESETSDTGGGGEGFFRVCLGLDKICVGCVTKGEVAGMRSSASSSRSASERRECRGGVAGITGSPAGELLRAIGDE